jgi:hypothetical protein
VNATLQLDIAAVNNIDAKRETIGQSPDRIAVDITNGLREANLDCPLYICIPSGGRTFVLMMTLLNRSGVN